MNARESVVRYATPGEAEEVTSIILEAAEWLVQRGDPLWLPSEIESGDIRRDVESGLYLIALESGAGVGAARFTRDDPLFWPEAEAGEAGYVHRLAVRRSHAKRGVSAALLAQAGTLSKSFGARYLRLDCDAARPRLRAFYESFGFVFHSVATVGPHTVARYQLLVA